MPQIRPVVTLLLVLVLQACAGKQAGGSFVDRNVLTREQIDEARATNAYDAVQRLRSRWLQQRGSSQMPSSGGPQFQEAPIQAYLDNQRLGSVEALRSVEIAAVQYIRFFSATEASARWGLNHTNGAVFVSTRPLEQ